MSRALQIGGKWAVTAAHCVFNKETNRALEPGLLSILLGLVDKRGTSDIAKWVFLLGLYP